MKTTNAKVELVAREEIIDLVSELVVWVKQIPFLIAYSIKMRLAIALADMQQKAFNKRFFVINVVKKYRNGKPVMVLRSINNKSFDMLKKKGYLPKNMSYLDLSAKSYYQTELKRNNTQKLEARQKAMRRYRQYLEYLNK